MQETISYYITTMIQKGFTKYDFELLGAPDIRGRCLRKSWNAIRLEKYAKAYVRKLEIDITTFSQSELVELSAIYVEENIPPQFTDEKGDGWCDETYDIWSDVFISLGETAYLELFETDFENFVLKTSE